MLLLGYSISIFMRVHMSIYAFNTDFNESIYFYDGYTYAMAVIHFLSFSLYIYEHDRLYTDYIDIYYDYSGSTTSMRTRCRAAYRTLFKTVVALLLRPSQEDRAVTRRQ